MCSLILFSLYTNDMFKYKNRVGTVAKVKVKLLTKIKNYNSFILELWYQHHTITVEITHKIWTSFKTLGSNKTITWRLKKSQSRDKFFIKSNVFQLSDRKKTLIEVSYTNNIHTGEKCFCNCFF